MDIRKRLIAIINPISGTRHKEDLPTVIREELDSNAFSTEIIMTQYAGHAEELTRKAVDDGIDYVLAVGGDGTCNEVSRGLINSSTALGIIPVGSGNGLARHLGIPLNVRKALQIVNDNRVIELDYCTANDKPFFCTCGMGFDALISLKFAEGKRRGGSTYVVKALTEYLKDRPETYCIETPDGIIKEKAFLIACGNASQYGNNAYIAPHASMQDGKIDVTIIRPFTPFDTALLGLQLFTKQIDHNTNIRSFTTDYLSIVREKPGVMHIDGEPIEMAERVDIHCIHAGLRAIAPLEERKPSLIEPFESVFWELVDTVKNELNI